MEYDSKADTKEHVRHVRSNLKQVIQRLKLRAEIHDQSKLEPPEKEIFDEWTPKLRDLTYGSKEYRDALEAMTPALVHHYTVNRHHPEYFSDGVEGMNLLDLLEMMADWKAAVARHANGDFDESLNINERRFRIPPILMRILRNTADDLGWSTKKEITK